MDDKTSLTVYGLSRSLPLLLVFIVTFVGLTYILTMLLFNNPLFSIVGGAVALALCGVIYGIMRFYSEQIIAYITANIGIILHNNMVDDEGVDDGQI